MIRIIPVQNSNKFIKTLKWDVKISLKAVLRHTYGCTYIGK